MSTRPDFCSHAPGARCNNCDPGATDYVGEYESCDACHGEGFVISCIDDMCHGQGWCMHGDGEVDCPECGGSGELEVRPS